ncbi:hypothetical protein Leryth_025864 [Lithospermum erythrorhizon]|nr:hypothetical protein Leryth_025864 [Lithospermum erythrorhizon]
MGVFGLCLLLLAALGFVKKFIKYRKEARVRLHFLPNMQIIQASNAVANGTGHNYSTASGQAHYSTAHGQTYAAPLAQGGTPIPAPPSQSIQPSYGPTPSILNKRIKAKGRKMKSQQPPQSARCELCKVDCNSLEIFEQHKNGKKHQKNLKAHKGLQTLNNVMVVGQTAPENEPEMSSQFENVEGSNDKQLPIQTSSCVAANTGEQKAVQADGTEESTARKRKKKSVEAKGKMKNGKGVKWIRSDDGSKIPVEAPKPQVIPLICELCNVTCESPVVFHAHLTGKKHLANLKRFQSEQEILGHAAVQALYPALQALYPALQALCQGDMTSLISLLQQQGFLGVQPQPVPSNYFQGQVSEVPPATADLTEIPHSAAFPEQQPDIPPTGLETAGASQVVAVTEGKSDEQPSPAPEVTKDAESEILEGK